MLAISLFLSSPPFFFSLLYKIYRPVTDFTISELIKLISNLAMNSSYQSIKSQVPVNFIYLCEVAEESGDVGKENRQCELSSNACGLVANQKEVKTYSLRVQRSGRGRRPGIIDVHSSGASIGIWGSAVSGGLRHPLASMRFRVPDNRNISLCSCLEPKGTGGPQAYVFH